MFSHWFFGNKMRGLMTLLLIISSAGFSQAKDPYTIDRPNSDTTFLIRGTDSLVHYNSACACYQFTGKIRPVRFSPWSTVTALPTTLSGFGITDGATITQLNTKLNVTDTTTTIMTAYKADNAIANINAISQQRLFLATASQPSSNTTSEVTLFSSTAVGSNTYDSNFWKAGKTIIVEIEGTYQTPTVPGGVTVRVKLGGTTRAFAAIGSTILATSSTTNRVMGRVLITCRSTGTSGVFVIAGGMSFETGVGVVATFPLNNGGSTFTMNTTASTTLDCTAQWSNANSMQGQIITMANVMAVN